MIDCYIFMLLLVILGTVQALRVAIIGCGAGGTSAAYFLRSGAIIYEASDECGGRAKNIVVGDQIIEVGGTMLIEDNYYINAFIKQMGLEKYPHGEDRTVGIVDKIKEKMEIILQTSSYQSVTIAKLLYKYGSAPKTLSDLCDQKLKHFLKIYNYLEEGKHFNDFDQFLRIIGLSGSLGESTKDYFVKNGVSEEFIDDFVAGVVAGIYNQPHSETHALAGLISMIAAAQKTYSIKGGNRELYKKLSENFGGRTYLNTRIDRIEKLGDGDYRLHFNDTYEDYEYVIIANLMTPENHIELYGDVEQNLLVGMGKIPLMNNKRTVVTVIAGEANPNYFGLNSVDDLPTVLLSKNMQNTDFSDFQFVCRKCHNGQDIFKIQSHFGLSEKLLKQMFKQYEVISIQDWQAAYPKLDVKSYDIPHFELDKNLFYLNAMEYVASVMEMEMISARNIANKIFSQDTGRNSDL